MIKYAQTTTLILFWCFLFSVGWTGFVYALQAYRKDAGRGLPKPKLSGAAILPALVVGPVMLVTAFRVAGINLLFPVHFFASFAALAAAALVPAGVLLVASGMAAAVRRATLTEYEVWSAKTFTRVALAVGRSPHRVLRRLVIVKALTQAWSQCLPWAFGELIIVETVFNAPGLGLDAWHLARTRDLAGLGEVVVWLAGLYLACVGATALVNRWLGKRLESYA